MLLLSVWCALFQQLFALLLGRSFGDGDGASSTPANGSATLRTVVEQVASRAASAYPSEPWTLLVTSDSPAVRAAIVQRARAMGYTSVQAFGTVRSRMVRSWPSVYRPCK